MQSQLDFMHLWLVTFLLPALLYNAHLHYNMKTNVAASLKT